MIGSWLVCLVPRFVAKWLMWGSGCRVRLPGAWIPHMFGRAIGAKTWRKL